MNILELDEQKLEEVLRRVESIKPLLAGQDPDVIAAVLAELLAILIAGHRCELPENTAALHEEMLQLHIDVVRKLIPLNTEIISAAIKEPA